MSRLKEWFFRFVIDTVEKKPKVRVIDCGCGKTYEVHTNVYDNSDSGFGSCECGECTTHIN